MTRKSPNNNLVLITACVEKPATTKRSQQMTDRTNKSKPTPLPKKFHTSTKIRSNGRRAQLLAYARDLRSSGTEQPSRPFTNSSPKLKKGKRCKSSPLRSRMSSFFKLFQRKETHACRYERIPTLEIGETDLCGLKCGNMKRRNHLAKISSFCSRLKRMLRELSCGLQCNKS